MHASRETCRTRDAREAHLSSLARVREIRDCSPSSPWATIASSHFHFIHNSLIHSVSGVYLTLLVAIFFSHLSFVCFDSLLGHRRRSTNAVPPPRTPSALSCIPSCFCIANMDHTAIVPIILELKVNVRTLQKEEDRKTTKEDHLKLSYQCLDH